MQASRFDQFVRSLAEASRRQVLKALAGTAFSGFVVRRNPLLSSARQASLPCPPCLSCETCDPSTGRCLTQCGSCEVCDPALDACRKCAACEVCDEFTEGQCVPQCEPCDPQCQPCMTCDASIDTCRPCDPNLCETCDPVFGGCRGCAPCEKCDTSSGQCVPICSQCETCDPVLGVCRGCDRCHCEECDPATDQCRGCDADRCERCDPESGRCVEGCSGCEECDPRTGACVPRCEQCQECDSATGKCRECLPCEKCDEETGRCVSVCEQCLICDPERGECRPCAEDRCEVCDKTTGQCLPLCCPGEQCDQRECGQLRENCLMFESDGPNPRPEDVAGIPVVFDIYVPPGRPVPPYIRATSSQVDSVAGGMTGLNIGFLTTVTLYQPVSAVELTLTHTSSPVRVAAYAGGVPVDTAAMNPAFGGALETLRLEGAGIDYLELTAPGDEAHLTKLCVCRPRC
jgi:hypothetical protein